VCNVVKIAGVAPMNQWFSGKGDQFFGDRTHQQSAQELLMFPKDRS
jgi:hypothetical protein